MKIRAKIEAPSKANRLRRVEKAETKANPFRISYFPYSERMIHFRINGKGNVIETVYYPFNN
jgi:hypothetical protein